MLISKGKTTNDKSSKAKKSIKLNAKNHNGYEAVYIKGCAGIFFFVFASIFVLIFAGGFGLFENFKVSHIPYILYTLLAIGLFFRYYAYVGDLRRTYFDDENFRDYVFKGYTTIVKIDSKNEIVHVIGILKHRALF